MFNVKSSKSASCQRCDIKFTPRSLNHSHSTIEQLRLSKSWLGLDGYQILLAALKHKTEFNLDNDVCDSCLSRAINHRCDTAMIDMNLEQQVAFATQFYRDKELIEHIDYSIENGCYVFSRWFHLKRGTCCENQCRHCPYNDWSQK